MIASVTANVVTTCRARVGGAAGARTGRCWSGRGAMMGVRTSGVAGIVYNPGVTSAEANARRSHEGARQAAARVAIRGMVRQGRQGRIHPPKLDAQPGVAGGCLR